MSQPTPQFDPIADARNSPVQRWTYFDVGGRGLLSKEVHAAIDDKTRVLTASTVTFSPGFRTDIDRLGRT